MPPSSSRYSRDALLLFASTLLYGFAFRGLMPVLRQLYVLRLGYDARLYGLWSSMGPLGFLSFSFFAGLLGAKLGERRAMILGGLAVTAAMAVLPLVEVWPQTWNWLPFVSNVLMSSSWSMVMVNQAPAVARAVPPNQRSKAYALLSGLTGLGGFIGAWIAGQMPTWTANSLGLVPDSASAFAAAIWIKVALILLCIVPVLFVTKSVPRATSQRERSQVPWQLAARVMLLCILTQAGVAVLQMFASAYMDRGLSLPASAIGSISSFGQLAATLAAFASPWVTRKLGMGKDLLATTAILAIGLLPVILVRHWLAVAISFALVYAMNYAWRPMFQNYMFSKVPAEQRSVLSGIFNVASGLAFGSMSFGGGYIIASIGYQPLFAVGASMAALGVGAFMVANTRDKHEPTPVYD